MTRTLARPSHHDLSLRAHALLHGRNRPRLILPGIVVAIVAFAIAYVVMTLGRGTPKEEERAATLAESGRATAAEAIYARLVRERPTVPLAIALVEEHMKARAFSKLKEMLDASAPSQRSGLPDADPPMSEEELDAILVTLPEDVALPALFWRGVAARSVPDEIRAKLVEGADREPPAPFHNRLLAREALQEKKLDVAAPRFEREGLAFPERRADVDAALAIWMSEGAWDHVRSRLADPRVAAAASPHSTYQLAVHDGDWKTAARAIVRMWRPRFTPFGLAMATTCAIAWAFFCGRLGKVGESPKRRIPLYLAAFALGVASVLPTAAIIAVEEAKLRLVETGDAGRDVLFFVFGVGLREELSKLLLFTPLLFFLRRGRRDKLEVLVCGAMVGLGFAAEENLGYLAHPNVHGALARFLTANFFHMSATGVLAMALDDFLDDRERHATDFTRISLLVVGMHGAYDFLLSHQEMGGSYLAMAVFVFLARMFLGAVDVARRKVDRTVTLLHAFVFAVAVVVGVSGAHAFQAAGLTGSVALLAEGLVGLALIVFVFVRTLRNM